MSTLNAHPELLTEYSPADADGYLARSSYLSLPFIVPVIFCGLSWMLDGVPLITDLAFLILTVLSGLFLLREFMVFPRRFGIGGILLFGGVLVWFCHDYLWNWMGKGHQTFVDVGLPEWVMAKSGFFHCLFIMFMVLGLQLRRGQWLSNLIRAVPEPPGSRAYAVMLLLLFLFGISPYFIFTVDPWYVAIYKSIVSGRSEGLATGWTVGRTGNLNYSWGGYVAQIIDIGYISGIVGAFYAILIARSIWGKLFGWFCWVIWLLLGFGTGTRTQIAMLGLPAVVFLYINYQSKAASVAKHSVRAYVYAAIIVVISFLMVQIQATYRNKGFLDVEMENVELAKPKGNHMFSEGLTAFYLIPAADDFFYNRYPGQGLVFAVPMTVYRFVIGPIPRALWNSKPVDPAWVWYNHIASGGRLEGYEGTTVALGLVGHWYTRYGFFGVIEGGLIVGWLMRSAERALQYNGGKTITILLSVAISAWIFGLYRDINFSALYPIIFAGIIMSVLVPLLRLFAGPPTTNVSTQSL